MYYAAVNVYFKEKNIILLRLNSNANNDNINNTYEPSKILYKHI